MAYSLDNRKLFKPLIFAAFLSTSCLQAQQVAWIQAQVSAAPAAGCCAGMAFDLVNQGSVLFGGSSLGGGGTSDDTWVWRSGAWSELTPAESPHYLQGAGMAWDPVNRMIVLFGGTNHEGTSVNDTWIWDGRDWIKLSPPVSPSPRRFDCPAMIYDAATGLIMFFGGTGPNGYLGDTWSWNGTTRTWTENHPRQSPSPRRTMLAYDYSAAILFGGDQGSLYYGDTWTWDGTNWRLRSPDVAPSSRTMGAMVWDDALKRVVLFGGSGGPNSTDALNDTWFWQDGAWTPADVIGELPPARWAAGSDYDAASQKLVLFGGFTTYPLGDTWLLSPASGAPQN